MNEKIYNIRFLRTGDSAHSHIAEAVATTMAPECFNGFGAGNKPAVRVDPYAVRQVTRTGCSGANLCNKSRDERAASGAPAHDYIIPGRDDAGNEANGVCPIWPCHLVVTYTGFADLAAVTGNNARTRGSRNDFRADHGENKRIRQFAAPMLERHPIEDVIRAVRRMPLQQS